MDAVNDRVEQLKADLQEQLRDYGQYLAMRGALHGEQRFGVPEAGLAVLSLIIWAVGKYVSSYLAERAKLDVAKPDQKTENRIREVEDHLEQMQVELRRLRDGGSVAPGLIVNGSDGTPEFVEPSRERRSGDQFDLGRTDLVFKELVQRLLREREYRIESFTIDEDALVAELKALGLSERSARKAASRIKVLLTSAVKDLLR